MSALQSPTLLLALPPVMAALAWKPIIPFLHALNPDVVTPHSERHRLSLARILAARLAALFPEPCEVEWRPGGHGVYLRAPHSVGVMQVYNWEEVDDYVTRRLAHPEEWPEQHDDEEEEDEEGGEREAGTVAEEQEEEEGTNVGPRGDGAALEE
jgi:hypothetical protein